MSRALRTAASGMNAQQITIEVISNNIANVNTTAFKKNKAEFQDLMYQQVAVNSIQSSIPGTQTTTENRIQVGNGVQTASTQKIFQQGDIVATNNELDLAIQGEGFFQLRRPDGSFAYTRDGSFQISADGSIITSSGLAVEPGLSLNSEVLSIKINREGSVEVQEVGGATVTLGNIQLVRFMNNGGLIPLGDNLYAESPSSGQPMYGNPGSSGFGEVVQGYLESSNVDIVEEMIAMITAQRAYEINSKTVKTVEDMMTMANNLKR